MTASQLSTVNCQLRHPSFDYVELRTRSAFSFLAGASLPEDLVARAAALDYPVLALGDRDGVYGAPRFHQAAQRAGMRAIIGAELTLAPEEVVRLLGCYVVKGREETQHLPPNNLTTNNLTTSLYLLAASRTGYQNLCTLITQTKLRAPKGQSCATWEDLEGRTEGLICLFRGKQGVERLRHLFPNHLYLELQRHLDPDQERINRWLLDVGQRYGIPVVATNDVRHATAHKRPLLDVLTCLHEKTTLDAAGRRLLKNAERHLKSAADMTRLFRDLPEALANTRRIAEQCEFTLQDLGYRFPEYPLPPGETPIGYLRQLAYAGARERYRTITPRVRAQLEHELAIIGKLDLAGYFLIVWDIVRFCREQRILAQGRGSAANSAVCYSLGITAVDSIGMELLFERFLSEERGEWPDIDIDLPSGDQRERVIQYVYQRYGERGAAMTANVITYRTRLAVREVGKALGFSEEQVGQLSKLLNRFEFRDDLDELAKQLKAGGVDPTAPRVRQLVDLVGQIQNLPRHLGQHSGGMVIAAGRLDQVVPLEPASMPGRVVVQWDKDDCADLGIIKVDLLGLGMMAVLEESIPLIREHEGVDVDLAHLPPDDPKVYGMLQKADTIGVFQVESRAQMATLPRMKPDHFYDLVVEVAIIRPGPIVGQMVHPYLDRRSGRKPVTYAHPDLEPILKRTLGVPLFQEQLLRMAMTVAGFSGGEAEELRRAMGFKRSTERMAEIESRLRSGMTARGIVGKTQDDIVRSITSFALYGFPESHAASFALLAYASAYLRAHHLAAFTCALLNNWPMGFYHPATLIKDAQRHGLRVLPIDVTRSSWKCTLEEEAVTRLRGYAVREDEKAVTRLRGYAVREIEENDALTANRLTASSLCVRLGLKYVAALREEVGRRIEIERSKEAFASVADVAVRCALRNNELATLAHLGAFAAFGLTRREALWQLAGLERGGLFESKPVRERPDLEGTPHGFDSRAIVSRTDCLASINGISEGLLSVDEEISSGRTIRNDKSDPSCRDISSSEHRGGQWARDEKGLQPFSADRTGQFTGARNVLIAPAGSELNQPGGNRASSDAARLDSSTTKSADPGSRNERWSYEQSVEEAVRRPETASPLTANRLTANRSSDYSLPEMSLQDRTLADYQSSGVTVGPHIMKYLRDELTKEGVLRAIDLPRVRDGRWTKIAGLVIVRQRPGTAKGFCFLTLEDETGTANAVVVPDMFQRHRSLIHTAALLLVEGPIQKSGVGWQVSGAGQVPHTQHPTPDTFFVIHVRARRFRQLELPQQPISLTGHGYRMRVTPEEPLVTESREPNNQQPNNEQPLSLPKSHDFR